ncbi:MAG: IgGFc-binding protein [Candidatus Kapabacteria bacterium]|nr:IgGFc-binding protein [Candidatus Kapabacteria bacterium]
MELTSEGKEFWVCFQRNHEEGPKDTLSIMLFLTSQWESRAQITIAGLDWDTLVRIPAQAIVPVRIPPQAELRTVWRAERLAVHVQSDTPIAVYGLNRRRQSTDTYMALPLSVLGTEYRVMTYRRLSAYFVSQVAVIATADSTEVTIMPAEVWGSAGVGVERGASAVAYPQRLWLQRGQVYQIQGPSGGEPADLTGMLIRASKPVAVFSGHVCAYVPLTVPACNHLVEQLPPVQAWGRHYYVGKLRWRSRYVVRVVAHYPETRLFVNDRWVKNLTSGEFWEQTFTENVQISSDKPILVAQFSEGYQSGDSIGDPMMLLLTPTQQFLRRYRFATPVQGSWRHFLNVIVPISVLSSLRFNGAPVRANFERIGNSSYAVAALEIPYGSHSIEADEPFGLYAYGFGYGPDSYDAYGNPVGQAFVDVEQQRDFLPPFAEIDQVGSSVNALVRDDRPTDRGLQEVRVLRSENLEGRLSPVSPGMLRTELRFTPADPRRAGYAILAMTDMAGNRSAVTLCYSYDLREERFIFVLCEGEQENCSSPVRLWSVGAFVQVANVQHAAAVPRSGNLPPMYGVFGDAMGWGSGVGVVVGYRVGPHWGFVGRLVLEGYGGRLQAPDTVLQQVRQTDGSIAVFQEERDLALRMPYFGISLGGTWFPLARLYLQGELQIHWRLGNVVELRRRILQPPGYIYSETRTPLLTEPVTTFSSLRPFYWSAALAAGLQYPFSPRSLLLVEVVHTRGLSYLVSIGRWRVAQIGIRVGMLHRWWY